MNISCYVQFDRHVLLENILFTCQSFLHIQRYHTLVVQINDKLVEVLEQHLFVQLIYVLEHFHLQYFGKYDLQKNFDFFHNTIQNKIQLRRKLLNLQMIQYTKLQTMDQTLLMNHLKQFKNIFDIFSKSCQKYVLQSNLE